MDELLGHEEKPQDEEKWVGPLDFYVLCFQTGRYSAANAQARGVGG